jgi:hypothetical protein
VISINVHQKLFQFSLGHECFHVILMEQGYPCIAFPNVTQLPQDTANSIAAAFMNAIQHGQVIKRLKQEFSGQLEMYLTYWRDNARQTMEKYARRGGDATARHVELPTIFSWLWERPLLVDALKLCQIVSPDEYEVCQQAYDEAKNIGTETPEAATTTAEILLRNIVLYCRREGVQQSYTDLWAHARIVSCAELFGHPHQWRCQLTKWWNSPKRIG